MEVIRDAETRAGSAGWSVASPHEPLEPSRRLSGASEPRAVSRILGRMTPYIAIARPDHWFKNVFMGLGVLLAYFCHPETFSRATLVQLIWAAAATCLLA